MKLIKKAGTLICKCGFGYNWKTYFLEKGEIVTFKNEDVQDNVINNSAINEQYYITTCCPKCGKKEYLSIMK